MTKKTKLVPFDYELYKSGSRAIYEGNEVTDLYLFKCENPYPLVGVYHNGLVSFTKDGKSVINFGPSLFLEQELEEKTFYVNVYDREEGKEHFFAHNTLECARGSLNDDLTGRLKITYTEEDLIK